MRDTRELLHTATNNVLIMGLAIERLKVLHPEDPVLVRAAAAYAEMTETLRQLKYANKTGLVPDK